MLNVNYNYYLIMLFIRTIYIYFHKFSILEFLKKIYAQIHYRMNNLKLKKKIIVIFFYIFENGT